MRSSETGGTGRRTLYRSSEVTPKHVYLNRRRFLSAGAAAAAALAAPFSARATMKLPGVRQSSYKPGNEAVTSEGIVTTYNNFYEFGTGKDEPAKMARNFKTSPWTLQIGGEVAKPKTLDLDAVMKLAPLEERIYRHRCVEGWSIVVPWIGFPLSALLKQVEPTGKAKFVAFESLYDSKQMISSRAAGIRFPYVEGLRLDEAMHPLALFTVGMYGETLPNQDGAPLRLVVPWKYGFKSIKSIVKITLLEKQPVTTWAREWPEAYGFYSNVNPKRDHPRFSQTTEHRLGSGRLNDLRDTLLFNGYSEVASLYTGMNLIKYY
jgi:methionine sulfoxide reductase catalytic subunit